jgi:hypothetical protein
LNRKADHKENEDDCNGPDSPGCGPGDSSRSNQNTVGIPEATSAAASLVDALNRLGVDEEQPNKVAADTDADQSRSSFRMVDSSTSLTITLRRIQPSKRPHSPDTSSSKIDLGSVRQLCVGGKMYELIDLTEDEVRFHRGILGFLCSPCVTIEQIESRVRTLFSFETKAKRVAGPGPPRLLYDAFGEAVPYTPNFHVSVKLN